MSQAARTRMTMAEFLEWEEQQEERYEFDGHHVVTWTGGTVGHSMICTNFTTALATRLRGKPCRVFGSRLKIEVAGSIRYPDAFVTCSPVAPAATVVKQPVIVFEVLSPCTAAIDFTEKHDEYRDTPSIIQYVLLRQDRVHATVFPRVDNIWSRGVLAIGETLVLGEIGVEIPMAELYEDLVFDQA